MDLILVAVISLGAIGLIAAVILYAASKKFAVYEDPRIAQVSEVLPQANCGGCGYPGCSGFAGACVKAADAGSLEGKLCPVGGAPVMEKVAAILGLEAVAAEPKVAVVRCNGVVKTALVLLCTMELSHVPSLMPLRGGRPVVHLVAWDVAIVWKCVSLMLFT